ncbi:MAG: hypothetical protein J4O07_01025 [Chloroflexi bacterium]|nr:hypothetical protein [Chloroflexota bacterium]
MRGSVPVRKVAASILLILIVGCGGGAEEVARPDGPAVQANILIRLVDPLDDPDHYCIDVVGFGSGVQLQQPLQAHTCKPTDNRDEQFTHRPLTGQLYMEEYSLCLQPDEPVQGSPLYLRECSDSPLQRFDIFADGSIRVGADGPDQFCVAVAPGNGEVINPIHKRRDLSLANCGATELNLMQWSFFEQGPGQDAQRGRESSHWRRGALFKQVRDL